MLLENMIYDTDVTRRLTNKQIQLCFHFRDACVTCIVFPTRKYAAFFQGQTDNHSYP